MAKSTSLRKVRSPFREVVEEVRASLFKSTRLLVDGDRDDFSVETAETTTCTGSKITTTGSNEGQILRSGKLLSSTQDSSSPKTIKSPTGSAESLFFECGRIQYSHEKREWTLRHRPVRLRTVDAVGEIGLGESPILEPGPYRRIAHLRFSGNSGGSDTQPQITTGRRTRKRKHPDKAVKQAGDAEGQHCHQDRLRIKYSHTQQKIGTQSNDAPLQIVQYLLRLAEFVSMMEQTRSTLSALLERQDNDDSGPPMICWSRIDQRPIDLYRALVSESGSCPGVDLLDECISFALDFYRSSSSSLLKGGWTIRFSDDFFPGHEDVLKPDDPTMRNERSQQRTKTDRCNNKILDAATATNQGIVKAFVECCLTPSSDEDARALARLDSNNLPSRRFWRSSARTFHNGSVSKIPASSPNPKRLKHWNNVRSDSLKSTATDKVFVNKLVDLPLDARSKVNSAEISIADSSLSSKTSKSTAGNTEWTSQSSHLKTSTAKKGPSSSSSLLRMFDKHSTGAISEVVFGTSETGNHNRPRRSNRLSTVGRSPNSRGSPRRKNFQVSSLLKSPLMNLGSPLKSNKVFKDLTPREAFAEEKSMTAAVPVSRVGVRITGDSSVRGNDEGASDLKASKTLISGIVTSRDTLNEKQGSKIDGPLPEVLCSTESVIGDKLLHETSDGDSEIEQISSRTDYQEESNDDFKEESAQASDQAEMEMDDVFGSGSPKIDASYLSGRFSIESSVVDLSTAANESRDKVIERKSMERRDVGADQKREKKLPCYWELWEHMEFLRLLRIHGKGKWALIASKIPSRTHTQVKSHAHNTMRKMNAGIDVFERLDDYLKDPVSFRKRSDNVPIPKKATVDNDSKARPTKQESMNKLEYQPDVFCPNWVKLSHVGHISDYHGYLRRYEHFYPLKFSTSISEVRDGVSRTLNEESKGSVEGPDSEIEAEEIQYAQAIQTVLSRASTERNEKRLEMRVNQNDVDSREFPVFFRLPAEEVLGSCNKEHCNICVRSVRNELLLPKNPNLPEGKFISFDKDDEEAVEEDSIEEDGGEKKRRSRTAVIAAQKKISARFLSEILNSLTFIDRYNNGFIDEYVDENDAESGDGFDGENDMPRIRKKKARTAREGSNDSEAIVESFRPTFDPLSHDAQVGKYINAKGKKRQYYAIQPKEHVQSAIKEVATFLNVSNEALDKFFDDEAIVEEERALARGIRGYSRMADQEKMEKNEFAEKQQFQERKQDYYTTKRKRKESPQEKECREMVLRTVSIVPRGNALPKHVDCCPHESQCLICAPILHAKLPYEKNAIFNPSFRKIDDKDDFLKECEDQDQEVGSESGASRANGREDHQIAASLNLSELHHTLHFIDAYNNGMIGADIW